MKKLTTLAAAALALAMTGAGALAETTLQLGTTVNEQDSFQVAAEKFAELVEERTNGEYKIEIYPNGTLGGESDMLDSMSTGMLDMGIITSGPFVNFSEAMGVLDMPYLFANNEEAYKVFDGEIGRELLDSLEDAGLKGLAYAERGFRNVTNSVRPVTCADDLAGHLYPRATHALQQPLHASSGCKLSRRRAICSVARTRASVMPGSEATCPASRMICSSLPGQAWCSSQALSSGQIMS